MNQSPQRETEQGVSDDAPETEGHYFERLVTDLTNRLISSPSETLPAAVDEALEGFLAFFDVDRCALMQVLPDRHEALTIHAAYREGMMPQPRVIHMRRDFPYLSGRLLRGSVERWDRDHDLPPEAETDRRSLTALGAHAFLLIPIAIGGTISHFMGFNVARERAAWPDEYVPRLRVVGEMIVNALAREHIDDDRKITISILSRANSATSAEDLISGVTSLLKEWSGCDAVGIRLRSGDDFPYFEAKGFPADFNCTESSLFVRGAAGEILRGEDGRPELECLCGTVISGNFEPSHSYFSPYGSFWTNDASQLTDLEACHRRPVRLRGGCLKHGYASLALIPLRAGEDSFGLLQFNDARPGRFTEERIALFERLAYSITSAIARLRAVSALSQSEARLREESRSLSEALDEVNELRDQLRAVNAYYREEIKGEHNFEEIVGTSEPLRATFRKVEHVAPTEANVLLVGETGTGKELFARAIHGHSRRKDRPLVKVNCASLPAGLIESELFGHVKGAFTGALTDTVGRFQLADEGTLFLDEIGELDLGLQAKILRAVQEGEFERIGSSETIRVNVRIIAATNRDLLAAMDDGEFRADLYYRLAVFPIEIPPLRLRRDDIPLLTWHFVQRNQIRLGRRIERIPADIMTALVEYAWPGNVRELENVVERAMIVSQGPDLEVDGAFFRATRNEAAASNAATAKDAYRASIVRVLEECRWRIKGDNNAAERLGLKPSTLRYRMKRLGIERPTKRKA